MKLVEQNFVYGNPSYRFKVYSDGPTKAVLQGVVPDCIGSGIMEVYHIEAVPSARWVVVEELQGFRDDNTKTTYYVRRHGVLKSTTSHRIKQVLLARIVDKRKRRVDSKNS